MRLKSPRRRDNGTQSAFAAPSRTKRVRIDQGGEAMPTVDVAQAQRELPDLIRAVVGGENVVIVGASGSVRLVAVEPQARPRFGSARGMFTIRDDFDAPLHDFAPYERSSTGH
jgi:antitoxin (DNA-binding transcriptional repressor) of toxin-antitoxin stability system